jgi:hypothetical protein
MSDTPKFTVVDRRKFHADDEAATTSETTAVKPAPEPEEAAPKSDSGPRLKLVEPIQPANQPAQSAAQAGPSEPATAVAEDGGDFDESQLPPMPTPEESSFQKAAYEQAADRLNDLVRAQNPGAPAPETIGFQHLVQQLYLSAMMQMGAGTPEGQRPRIDILGARQTIDLLDVVLEKTNGSLTADENRSIQTVLFELRMTFLELTRMISAQPPMPPPPGGAKR